MTLPSSPQPTAAPRGGRGGTDSSQHSRTPFDAGMEKALPLLRWPCGNHGCAARGGRWRRIRCVPSAACSRACVCADGSSCGLRGPGGRTGLPSRDQGSV